MGPHLLVPVPPLRACFCPAPQTISPHLGPFPQLPSATFPSPYKFFKDGHLLSLCFIMIYDSSHKESARPLPFPPPRNKSQFVFPRPQQRGSLFPCVGWSFFLPSWSPGAHYSPGLSCVTPEDRWAISFMRCGYDLWYEIRLPPFPPFPGLTTSSRASLLVSYPLQFFSERRPSRRS